MVAVIKPVKRGLFSLRTKLTPETFRLLTNFPGFSKWDKREFLFRPSGNTIAFMEQHYPDCEWIGEAEDYRLKEHETRKIAEENRAAKASDYFDDSGYEYERPPMDHQAKAFALSRDRDLFAYFMEQGTGKTKVTIDTATWLYEQGKIDCLVVVAWPNGVHRSWIEEEIPKDLPSRINYSKDFWDSAVINKTKHASIESVLNGKNELSIITFNVEAFASQRAKDCLEQFLDQRNCMFVIDQSACIKTWTAKRTKFMIKMSKKAKYKRILDGDPATEGAEELFSQMYFLDPLIIGCDNWTNFKASYCRIGRFNDVIGYINLEELLAKIEPYVFRAREEECLDLPKRQYLRWRYDLNKSERRIYDQLLKEDFAQFAPERDDEGVMETNLAMVKNMRLQQVSRGWFEDAETNTLLPISKGSPSALEAFKGWAKHTSGKALIYTRFKADIFALEQLLGDEAVSYHGGINSDDRALAKYRFMNEPDVRYFIGQPRAAGIGHTLTAAKHVLFYCNEPSLRFRTECEKRAHRNGLQDTLEEGERLQIWDMMANKTTDQKGIRALRQKRDLASVIMGDPESFFLIEDDEDD